MRSFGLAIALLCASSYAYDLSKTLVVLDESVVPERHQHFWNEVQTHDQSITFRSVRDTSVPLYENDVPSFDHIILFAPETKSFPPELSPQSLVECVRRGVNLLVVLSPELSEVWRDFAREFDVDFDDRGHKVIDHFAFDTELDDGSHTTIVVPLTHAQTPFISPETQAGPPVLFRGIAHEVGRLPLLSKMLAPPSTAYSYDSEVSKLSESPVEDLFISGTSTGLVSAFQAKNNARVTFVGSQDLFTDEFASAPIHCVDGTSHAKSGNGAFLADLVRWTFRRSGILRVNSSALVRSSDALARPTYRIREELDYTLSISALDQQGQWQPFVMDDAQFDLTMLDPHLRLPLTIVAETSGSTVYGARFHTPDRHGVFTLRTDYRRPGWTWLEDKVLLSVTPLRHDEYDRFIAGAWPYYGGALSVSSATVLFMMLWLSQ